MGTPSGNQQLDRPAGRRLGVVGYVILAVVYLVVLQGVGWLLTRGLDVRYAAPTTLNEMWRQLTVPVLLSVVLVAVVVTVFRWWQPILVDDRPVQRWLIAVPIAMAASILIVTNYAGLASKGIVFAAALLVSCLLVGVGEELMFRGLGVTVFRQAGFTEGKVALWVSLIFGLAHASNLITEGLSAFVQVLTTVVAGYLLYLIRRRAGGLWLAALIHGLWDFSLISGLVIPDNPHPLSLLALLVELALIVVLLIRRKDIEPVKSEPSGSTG